LDAAYNLARWLTRNDHDAQDVVQEASLRAFKYWKGFSGRDCRSWLLAIVRNTFYSWVRQRSVQPELTETGEIDDVDDGVPNPENLLLQNASRDMLKAALDELPTEFREAIVLREWRACPIKKLQTLPAFPSHGHVSPGTRAQAAAELSDECCRTELFMTCKETKNLLNAYVDGELDSAAAFRSRATCNVAPHVSQTWRICVACLQPSRTVAYVSRLRQV